MKMMKNLLITAILGLTMTMTACGGSNTTPQESTKSPTPQESISISQGDPESIPSNEIAETTDPTPDTTEESAASIESVSHLLPGMMAPGKPYGVFFRFEDGILYVEGNGPLIPPRYGYVDEMQDKNLITEVVIGEGITSIGDNAFYSYKNITKVTISDSVTAIDFQAFDHCTNLTTIEGGKNVQYVGAKAFYDTPWYDAQNDEFIFFHDHLLAYAGSDNNVQIPDGTKTICGKAFSENRSTLTAVHIPDSVIYIGDKAFMDCDQLTQVTGGENVKFAWQSAFWNVPWFESQTQEFVTIGQCLLAYYGSEQSVTIPDGIITIGSNAFYDNTYVEEIIIPERITAIGENAMMNCDRLHTVSLPSTLLSLGNKVFKETDLTSLVIPDGVQIIPSEMVSECDDLQIVTIPSSILFIGGAAFNDCHDLEFVSFGGTQDQWFSLIGEYDLRFSGDLYSLPVQYAQ